MKPVSLLVFGLLLSVSISYAQKRPKVSAYLFDANWKPCDEQLAKYIAYVVEENDTSFQWNYYHFTGSLINIESYKDERAGTPHGYFAWFDDEGRIDSSGYTFESKKHGQWFYYTDTLKVYMSEKYDKGRLVERKDFRDSMATAEAKDLTPAPGEIEAQYKSGDKAWINYIVNEYKYPARAEKFNIQGTVYVYFVVESNGSISGIRLLKSVELSVDTEAMRIIGGSPKWNPAVQKGRNVKAYRVQPITFSY